MSYKIKQAAGYLGTHSPLLSPGDTQIMSWPDDENELSSDDGPLNTLEKILKGRQGKERRQRTS